MPPTMAVRTLAIAVITALMPRPIAEKTCGKTRFLSQWPSDLEGRWYSRYPWLLIRYDVVCVMCSWKD
jgi:hypothetical protein